MALELVLAVGRARVRDFRTPKGAGLKQVYAGGERVSAP
jgi:hypothetical protein